MKQILLLSFILAFPLLLVGQKRTYSLNFSCKEICNDGKDNDNDGYVDYCDLDCYLNNLKSGRSDSRSSGECSDLSDELSCLIENIELIEGLDLSTEHGVLFCAISERITLDDSEKICLLTNERRLRAINSFLEKYKNDNPNEQGSEKEIANAIAKSFIALDCGEVNDIFEIEVSNEDPPGCTGCSVGQAGIVTLDHIRAREMLICAIDMLETYNGPNTGSPSIDEALMNHMGKATYAIGQGVRLILKLVEIFSNGTEYTLQANGSGFCSEYTLAWSFPAIHFTDVRLCDPKYFNEPPIERSSTLIHEWMHLYYIAGDIAYNHQREYSELGTLLHTLNADSFSELVKELCQ